MSSTSIRVKYLRILILRAINDKQLGALRLRDARDNLRRLLAKHLLLPSESITFTWEWNCPESPFEGLCVYSDTTDGGQDDCLFCHQPLERK